jgi:hypothetical protein
MRRNSLSVSRRHSGEALQPASQRPDHALPAHRRCAAPDSAALSDGNDLRRDPLAVRKATLASLLARAAPGLRFNEHLDEKDGPLVFAMPASSGSKASCRSDANSSYRSGPIAGLDQEQETRRAGRGADAEEGIGAVIPPRAQRIEDSVIGAYRLAKRSLSPQTMEGAIVRYWEHP